MVERSEKKIQEMLENLNEVIYATDENGMVTYVSPNIEAVSGYQSQEIIGRCFTDFVHPDHLLDRMAQFKKVLEGEAAASEYQFVTKDQRVVWVRTNARPIVENGRLAGVRGVLFDVTECKEAEEALCRSEEKYRILIENAQDAVFVTQDGVVKFMNPVAASFLGHDVQTIQKTPFLEFIHPGDRQLIQERYEKRIGGETVPDSVTFRVINKDGQEKSVDLNAVGIDWEGRPAILNFLRDITPQKELEEHLQRAQRLESIGTLAGGIAHNFNNLLMVIQSHANQLLYELGGAPECAERLHKILAQVQSGSRLTTQLLGYARGGRYEVRAVDLNDLLRSIADTFTAAKKEVSVHLNLAQALPEIEADRGQIEQVVYNLMINAADAMPQGGSLFIETSEASGDDLRPHKPGLRDGNYVRLKASDTGSGMTRETRERIFDPFFTTKKPGVGTGLGLSSVYGIIKNHGGAVVVDSAPGEGATFTVFLPATEKKPKAAPAATASPAAAVTEGRTVLVVDDEPVVLEVTAEILEVLGFSVISCQSGAEAVRIYEKYWEKIDLAMIDLTMPDMGGGETFDRMRRIDPSVRVILCSGYGQDGQADEVLKRGCQGFMQKPYNITSLSGKINEVLSDASLKANDPHDQCL